MLVKMSPLSYAQSNKPAMRVLSWLQKTTTPRLFRGGA